MNVVVFEDEAPAFKRLSKLIGEVLPNAEIVKHMDTVREWREWLANNPPPDVTFMDIHLADGDAFDLLEGSNIISPIIFTTAYDRYALEAFKTTAIDYLLKPVHKEDLQRAVHKLSQLVSFNSTPHENTAVKDEAPSSGYKKRFVIRFGEHIRTLATSDVAYFYREHKDKFDRKFTGLSTPIDSTH